jgi:hypothetical protein
VRRYFATDDRFVTDQRHSLELFTSQLHKWMVAGPVPDAPRRPDDDPRERKRQFWQKVVDEGNYDRDEAEVKFGGPLR